MNSHSVAAPDDRKARLLVINNMPAFYRTDAFSALADQFNDQTGGTTAVAYQVRRDPHGRGEWFFTPDDHLPYPYTFVSPETNPSNWRTGYPLKFGRQIFTSFAPTHVFAAGWDCPLSLTAAWWARLGRLERFGVWVESNPSTSVHQSPISNKVRSAFLRSSDFTLVPTKASAEWVRSLHGKSPEVLLAMNPVSLSRLPSGELNEVGRPSRAIFIGDLSYRKGFDSFCDALALLSGTGWVGEAWGRDVEGLGHGAPDNCRVHAARPLREILPLLTSRDILVIPSRSDPAPLVYSEGLALGLRTVVSDRIAYSDHAANTAGVVVWRGGGAHQLRGSLVAAASLGRPSVEATSDVRPSAWADQVLRGLRGQPG